MGYPVKFNGANSELKAPKGVDEISCSDLPVFKNGINCVSCWEFSEEELKEIIETKRIYVSIWFGKTQPPMFLGTEENVRAIIADNGVWKK